MSCKEKKYRLQLKEFLQKITIVSEMASSLHIYSIPECLTDEETAEDENDDWEVESQKKIQKTANLINPSKKFPTSRLVAASCNDINLVSIENEDKLYYSEWNIKSQVSTSLTNVRKFHHCPDSGASEKDNSDLFTYAAPFNKNAGKINLNPYQEIEDYNSNGDSPYETLLVRHLSQSSSSTSPQRPSVITSSKSDPLIIDDSSHYETLLLQPYQTSGALNSNELISKNEPDSPIHISPKLNPTTEIRLDSEKRQSTSTTEVSPPQRHCSRGRSGSVQWIQNIIQNIDQKCRSFLDLRRPSDIAEEGIRSSNEELEVMEHSAEESSKNGLQSASSASGGRRFSENVIGKQHRRFPAFSSGFGHFKGLWKDRGHESKKQDLKDIDQIRPDVCPLFNFPRKSVDEDEMILDALRQAMRKCTVVDPSARPPSSSVFEQLSQIIK